ncbi:hypothetical protein COLO4_02704 [Corchorus olitorius]|uniref:Uncharacterized protein n=1 Tax=Corchorus olitorius TaxID=93759 RepID=A0A1R3L0G3_9ROSI|nr:hypothetical protein COLO4_02704 [Corchorus olitorius]
MAECTPRLYYNLTISDNFSETTPCCISPTAQYALYDMIVNCPPEILIKFKSRN